MDIKKIDQQSQPQALTFALKVFMQFAAPDYTKEGIQAFQSFINDQNLIAELELYGAYQNSQLIGMIATKNNNHISLFFVDTQHQNQGIGRKLFKKILTLTTANTITVNSSPYAVGIYQKLGFTATNNEQTTEGIKFTPMAYTN